MDIGDISKVATRKRLNGDAEKLREKVTRETAKIIKLKVAQDTAYWDLKEKLQQVEGNHERLQQNMVEVQMQHEAISGQYQDELRLRPETLNKMNSTREICDVLEEYSERLQDTLARCKVDQASLYDAYQRSGRVVRDMKQHQLLADEKNTQYMQRLEEELKLRKSQQEQLSLVISGVQQQAVADRSAADHAREAVASLTKDLALSTNQLQQKEEIINHLKNDMKQLVLEHGSQAADMKNMILQQEKQLKEATESNADLKKALSNQEDFSQGMCQENSNLQNKILIIEEMQAITSQELTDVKSKLERATSKITELESVVAELNNQKLQLDNVVKDKTLTVETLGKEIENLKNFIESLESKNMRLGEELDKVKLEYNAKTTSLEDSEKFAKELEKNISDLKKELQDLKLTSGQQVEDLSSSVLSKERELEERAVTISQLMGEVSESRARADAAVSRLRADLERATLNEKHAERQAREKDDELSKQMSIILEVRAEKERLQDKIQSMQNTIANIQKELTGRAPAGDPPELDDNAVMCPPTKIPEVPSSPKLPQPRHLDSMLFNLFSDSSMDGDTLDPSEVNRRFEALSRGERVSPSPLGSLRRRPGVPSAGLKFKHPTHDLDISLSQVKNDLKNKDKSFFKNKRVDMRAKKPK